MGWKDWSYWLKGGIILSLAYLVIGFTVVNYLTEYFLGPAPYGIDVMFSFFNIVGFPGFPLIGNSIKSGE